MVVCLLKPLQIHDLQGFLRLLPVEKPVENVEKLPHDSRIFCNILENM